MKRCIVVVTVVALLLPTIFVTAQGDDDLTQTYTSEDGCLSFNYPEGWFVNIDEDGEISVSNVENVSAEIGDVFESGQVSISIGVGSREDLTDDGFALPMTASAEFMAGFWTGLYSIAYALTTGFSDEPAPEIIISEVEQIELNGENVAIVQIDLVDTQSALIVTMPAIETSIRTLIVTSAYGEMDDFQGIAIAIIESVEFTP